MNSNECNFVLLQGKRKGSACGKKAYIQGKCHAHHKIKPKRAQYKCDYENRKGKTCGNSCDNENELCAKHSQKMKNHRKTKYEQNKNNIKKKYEQIKNDLADKYQKKKIEQIEKGEIFFPKIYTDRCERINDKIRGIHGCAKMFGEHIEGYIDKHNKGYIFPYHQKFKDPENIHHKLYYDDNHDVLPNDQIVTNLKREMATLKKQFVKSISDRDKLLNIVNVINKNADKYSITMHFLPDRRNNKLV